MKRYKIFDLDGKKYFFDGDIVKISEMTSEVDLGYMYNDKKIKPINAQRSNYLKSVCLVLNNSCNLYCNYCFANKGMYDRPNEQMTFETAKKIIDVLIKNALENNSSTATIAFFGGEPLLSFKLIQKIVAYTENLACIKFKYMITTNGTLINQEIANYFQKYKFDVMISIDGSKKCHNLYRRYKDGKGSYDQVLKAVKLFNYREILNARVTITDNNVNILECVESILPLNISRITFAVDYAISDEKYQLYLETLKKLLSKYKEDIKNNVLYDITNISSIVTSLVLNQRKLAFCNAGVSYLTVSADGKYYRCPRFVGKKEFSFNTDNKNINENLDAFRKTLKESPTKRNSRCAECIYVYLCGGMCYHYAISFGLTEFETVPRECIQRKILFEGTIKLLCELSPKERRLLLLFYTKLWNAKKRG